MISVIFLASGKDLAKRSERKIITQDKGILRPSNTDGIVRMKRPNEIIMILGLNQLYIPSTSPIILDKMSDVMRINEIMAITVNPKAKLTISNRSYLALIFSN
tara:strand:- start:34 stop:342 length:309 start_codon:yes stop_codon:yes gene_type:complete